MEKQAACAAPRSSSGFVPPASPCARAAQLTGKDAAVEESRETTPLPDNKSPDHTVVASLVTLMVSPPLECPAYARALAKAVAPREPTRRG
jgi:hypothetical protein